MPTSNRFDASCREFAVEHFDACLSEMAAFMSDGSVPSGKLRELAELFVHIPERHRLAEAVALLRRLPSKHRGNHDGQ